MNKNQIDALMSNKEEFEKVAKKGFEEVDTNKNVWYDFGLGKGGGLKTLVELLFHSNNFQSYLYY